MDKIEVRKKSELCRIN